MRTPAEPRVPKRLPCDVTIAGLRHSGLVLNVSPRGLFVQTNAEARPGSEVSIDLIPPNERDAVEVKATVVWKRSVPRQMLSAARGGMGLRITDAPERYYSFLSAVIRSANAPLTRPRPTVATSPTRATSPAQAAPAATPARREAPKAPPKIQTRRSYSVRVSQIAGSRSRFVRIDAATPGQAGRLALKEVGDGWQVLEVRPS